MQFSSRKCCHQFSWFILFAPSTSAGTCRGEYLIKFTRNITQSWFKMPYHRRRLAQVLSKNIPSSQVVTMNINWFHSYRRRRRWRHRQPHCKDDIPNHQSCSFQMLRVFVAPDTSVSTGNRKWSLNFCDSFQPCPVQHPSLEHPARNSCRLTHRGHRKMEKGSSPKQEQSFNFKA